MVLIFFTCQKISNFLCLQQITTGNNKYGKEYNLQVQANNGAPVKAVKKYAPQTAIILLISTKWNIDPDVIRNTFIVSATENPYNGTKRRITADGTILVE